MTMAVSVATASDIEAVATVMDKGFRSDPTVRWAAPDDEEFLSLHHKFVEACARPAFDAGGVHVLNGFAGAAVWYAPGVALDEAEVAMALSTASRPDRIEAFFRLLAACEEFRPEEPYWELELLAVDPEFQRQGMGARLLAFGLAICDSHREPVYLESSNPANLSIYKRHGFELLAEVKLPGTPARFPMYRKGR